MRDFNALQLRYNKRQRNTTRQNELKYIKP